MARRDEPFGNGFRCRRGYSITLGVGSLVAGGIVGGRVEILYDDGTLDTVNLPPAAITAVGDYLIKGDHDIRGNGTIIGGAVYGMNAASAPVAFPDVQGAVYIKLYLIDGPITAPAALAQYLATGYLTSDYAITVGKFQDPDFVAQYAFFGTVTEDATAGTHICTLTLTPGAGNAFQVQFGNILLGNSATAQTAQAWISDGAGHVLGFLFNPEATSTTTASLNETFPNAGGLTLTQGNAMSAVNAVVSGTMSLVLSVTTTAVSLTQTFGVSVRLKGTDLPTATLADPVGSPVLNSIVSGLF